MCRNPGRNKRPGAEMAPGPCLMAGGNTLDFSAHLPSIVREGAFVGEPQVPTTFERSGRPARRRLTFIGSQNPNQTKKHPEGCFFVWLGWMDSNHRNATVKVWCLTTWLQPNIKKKDLLTKSFFLVGWVVGFEPTIFSATN